MKYSLAGPFSGGISQQQYIPHEVSPRRKLSACITAAVFSASMITIQDVEAADSRKKSKNKAQSVKVVDELQAENARLREQLDAVQRERDLLKQGVVATPAAEGATVPAIDSAASGAAATGSAEVLAQKEPAETKDLGEVVVSGRRARPLLEKLHDVKKSESIISGKNLDQQLAVDLGAITRRASNVQFNQENTRGASLSIRGVGKRAFTETQDPSVGVAVDNIPYGLTQLANFSFYDVDNVIVTRGPRGTEGGLSASSGKVIVNNRAPTFTPTADLSVAYGQRESILVKGALGSGVIDDLLAWRASFIVDKADGYYKNVYDTNYSMYNRDRLSGRLQFLITPTSNITTRITADFEPHQPQLQNGLFFAHAQPFRFANGTLTDPSGTTGDARLNGFVDAKGVFTGPRAYFQNRGFTYNDYIGGEQRKTVWFDNNKGQTVSNQGGSIQTDWRLPSHVLSSVTGVRNYTFSANNDEYPIPTPFKIADDDGGAVDYTQITQEFKIQNKRGGFFDYTAGLFGIHTHDTIGFHNGWGADAGAWWATDAQYKLLDTNAGVNRGAGLAMLKDSLEDARTNQTQKVKTTSGAIFGEGELHFTDAFSIVPGFRVTKEHRTTTDEAHVVANGVGGAFNPVAVNGVPLGGFNSATDGTLQGTNTAAQLKLADDVANRYFGAANYAALTAAQKAQVGAAKAVRAGQIGLLYNPVRSEYDDVLYTGQFTPTYKINEDLTTYLSWQYGQKSGSALNIKGVPNKNVKPEETNAVELGLKSFWLDKAVIVNVDAFVMDIKNYQQTVRVVDEFQTNLNISNGQANPLAYTSAQGNVNKVRVHGVELDSVFNLIPDLSLRFSGAYNIAKYIDYKNAPKPPELAYLPQNFIDQSGQILPGASKWSFVVGADYSKPFYDKYLFHTNVTTSYQSGYNNLDDLSLYGRTGDRSITDFAIGVSARKNTLDASFIVKNVFNNNEHEEGWNNYSPNPYPMWYGIQISGKY